MSIKYEDLVKNTEEVIRKILKYIQLPFEKVCLEPNNAIGEIWKGNSTRNETYSGVSKKNLDSWKSEIHPLEVKLCNQVFKGHMWQEGYSSIQTQKSIWNRFPKENISRYLYNRATLKGLS